MVFKKFSPRAGSFSPKKMFSGSWQCADCKKEITELPFKPDNERPVYCRECWLKRKTKAS